MILAIISHKCLKDDSNWSFVKVKGHTYTHSLLQVSVMNHHREIASENKEGHFYWSLLLKVVSQTIFLKSLQAYKPNQSKQADEKVIKLCAMRP